MTPALQDSPLAGVGANAVNKRRVNTALKKLKILPRRMKDMLKSFLMDETGAELAEYAVAVALLVAIGLVVYKTLGNAVNDANSATGSTLQTPTFP